MTPEPGKPSLEERACEHISRTNAGTIKVMCLACYDQALREEGDRRYQEGRKDEREWCAKIALEEHHKHHGPYPGCHKEHEIGGLVNFEWASKTIAQAIRSDGQERGEGKSNGPV